METTGAIILAAGSSSRLGKSKQLLKLDGITLLENAIREIPAEIQDVVIILGANESAHKATLETIRKSKHNINVLSNKEWATGMGSSIKLGVRYLMENTKSDSALLLVCDQPFLISKHLERILSIYRETNKGIVASYYENTAGVPVLFSSKHFTSLLSISDSEGAKKVIRQNSNDIAQVDFPEGKFDIDTETDIEEFRRMTGRELG